MKDHQCNMFGHAWHVVVPGLLVHCSRCLMSKEIHPDGSHTYRWRSTEDAALADLDAQDAEWEDILPALDDLP